jgi:hypothetical protein
MSAHVAVDTESNFSGRGVIAPSLAYFAIVWATVLIGLALPFESSGLLEQVLRVLLGPSNFVHSHFWPLELPFYACLVFPFYWWATRSKTLVSITGFAFMWIVPGIVWNFL